MALPAKAPGPTTGAAAKPAVAPAPVRPAAPAPSAAAPAPTGPMVRKLRKGDLLFVEGENSRSMYYLKAGMIRIFKKKGDSNIEIDTIHSGQVIGELAFLDGNPRSASGEALTPCELTEISGPTFQEVLARMPDWLKILLKAVVGRLRTASTRIRQLEQASTSYDYSDRDGKRSPHYVYLSPPDVLKTLAGILLVATRNGGTATADGLEVKVPLVNRYVNQIMGVPLAKITSLIDVLAQCGIMMAGDESTGAKSFLKDPDFLEQVIQYLNEENLLEPSKRHDISIRSYVIMGAIAKNIGKYKKDERTGMTAVNLAEIKKVEQATTGREPFRMDEFPELVKFGYASNLNVKNSDEAFTNVEAEKFMHAFKLQRVVFSISAANEQKRKAGGK